MNKEHIVQMAWDAGKKAVEELAGEFGVSIQQVRDRQFEIFAAFIIASTKEEDAKICEDKADKICPEGKRSNQVDRHVADVLDRTAADIRESKP